MGFTHNSHDQEVSSMPKYHRDCNGHVTVISLKLYYGRICVILYVEGHSICVLDILHVRGSEYFNLSMFCIGANKWNWREWK